eukprot:TRINITY_DN10920_c0_g1_i3.p1 TRINITY_DN10920_c0_g1~~TRINITY_DN10920_c0_g1_i3.p1  ORF type:complete len:352 (-),score=20.38 TRINITY_DN10920_c0_g1_i3:252-1307(-)
MLVRSRLQAFTSRETLQALESLGKTNYRNFNHLEFKRQSAQINKDELIEERVKDVVERFRVSYDAILEQTTNLNQLADLVKSCHNFCLPLPNEKDTLLALNSILTAHKKYTGDRRLLLQAAKVLMLASEIRPLSSVTDESIIEIWNRMLELESDKILLANGAGMLLDILVFNKLMSIDQERLNYLIKVIDENVQSCQPYERRMIAYGLYTARWTLLENAKFETQRNAVDACIKKHNLIEEGRLDSDVVSTTELKILEFLRDLGYFAHSQRKIGIYSIDIFLKPRIVIEYHGVSHYVYRTNNVKTNSRIKSQVLQAQGYRHGVIPYWDWDILEKKEKHEDYLLRLIDSLNFT